MHHFLTVAAGLAWITMASAAFFTTAYDCENPIIKQIQDFATACTQGLCISEYSRFIMFHLKTEGIFKSHGLIFHENTSLVMLGDRIFKVECPSIQVTLIRTDKCFTNGYHPILLPSNTQKFIDNNGYIADYADQVPCVGTTLRQKIIGKMKDAQIKDMGAEILSFALLKHNPYFSVLDLVDNNTLGELLRKEECHLNNDPHCNRLTSHLLFLWRTYAGKIQMIIIASHVIYSIALFFVGCAYRLKIVKSLALCFSFMKRWNDIKSYIQTDKLNKQEKITKLHLQNLGQTAECPLSDMNVNHFECLYEIVISLAKRIQLLENVIRPETPSRDTTPDSTAFGSNNDLALELTPRTPIRNQERNLLRIQN